MKEFDVVMKSRVIFSPGSSERVGQIVRDWNVRRALVVTDPGIRKAGLDRGVYESLKREAMEIALFSDVEPNPTTENVDQGVQFARGFSPDLIVALGGGSSLDAGKAINVVFCRGGKITDYRGMSSSGKKLLPLIALPTTAGTGSEVSPFILISDAQSHGKIVTRDLHLIPDIALLDPVLTRSMPGWVTASTGVDALVHGIEAFVAKGSQPYSQSLALRAIETIYRTLPHVLERPDDLEGRGKMLVASNLAGMAFALSYLGLAHAMANPLTRVTGIAHGIAVGMVLPYVIRFNEPVAQNEYATIAIQILGNRCPSQPHEATLQMAFSLKRFITSLGLPDSLKAAGIPQDHLDEMAQEAFRQATVRSNPREATLEDLKMLYRDAYEGVLME